MAKKNKLTEKKNNKATKVNTRSTEELLKIKADHEWMNQHTIKYRKLISKKEDEKKEYADAERTYKSNRANSVFYHHVIAELAKRQSD